MASQNPFSRRRHNAYWAGPAKDYSGEEDYLDDEPREYHHSDSFRHDGRRSIGYRDSGRFRSGPRTTELARDYNEVSANNAFDRDPPSHYPNSNMDRRSQELSVTNRVPDPEGHRYDRHDTPRDSHLSYQPDYTYRTDPRYQTEARPGESSRHSDTWTSVQDEYHDRPNLNPWRRYPAHQGSRESIRMRTPPDSERYQEIMDENDEPHGQQYRVGSSREREGRQNAVVPYNESLSRRRTQHHHPPNLQSWREPRGYQRLDRSRQGPENPDTSLHNPEPRWERQLNDDQRRYDRTLEDDDPYNNMHRQGSRTDDQRRYDRTLEDEDPYNNMHRQGSRADEMRQLTSDRRSRVHKEAITVKIMNHDGWWCPITYMIDSGNSVGNLVSNGTIKRLGLEAEVDRQNKRPGLTLNGKFSFLGAILLDYSIVSNGETKRLSGTFHIFDDLYISEYDILFSESGFQDSSHDLSAHTASVFMVAQDKYPETEDERRREREREKRRAKEKRREEEEKKRRKEAEEREWQY